MGVLKTDDIFPDGIHVVVDWDQIKVGSSVFIPCIDTTCARQQVKKVFAKRGWSARCRIGIESGTWGVRIWRVA